MRPYDTIKIKTSREKLWMTRPSSAKFHGVTGDHRMSDFSQLSDSEIADRIAIVRNNLRQLTEQAAAQSGAANEERMAERIETQSKELDDLQKEQQRREQR